MLRLRTLGGLWLENEAGPLAGVAAQRRRLALLSVLAATGAAGVSRDAFALLFWPESDAEHAAGALRQLLHLVRQALPPDAVLATPQALRLNPAVVASDVAAFDAAVARGAPAEAAALYAGPFLDGFHLADAPEFARWAEGERGRRAQQVAAALGVLAADAARRGDPDQAAHWWGRRAALDPLDSPAALGLMRALDAAGNRPGALQHARVHAALVREQLGIAPDPAVLAYAERLRAAPAAPAAPERTTGTAGPGVAARPAGGAAVPGPADPADTGGAGGPAPAEDRLDDPPVAARPSDTHDASAPPSVESSAGRSAEGPGVERPSVPDPGVPHPVPGPVAESATGPSWWRRTGSRRRATAVTLAVLAVVGAVFAHLRTAPAGAVPGAPALVAVLPFAVRGGADLGYLGPGMVDLLSTNLDGAGALRAADPRAVLNAVAPDSGRAIKPERARQVAERFGAGLYVLGDVTGAAGRVRLTAALYDRRLGVTPVAQTAVEGGTGEILALVDQLTARLLAERYAGPQERLTHTAVLTTHSLPALKAYLAGERELRAGRFAPAIDAFQRAVAEDTSFALAYYRLGIAADWASRSDLAIEATEQAARHADRLSAHDRLLVDALLAWRRDLTDEAERRYRTVVGTYPDDVEAWFQLGEVLFHKNTYRGRSFVESRGPFARVLALEPGHWEALVHLTRVAAYEGRRADFEALLAQLLPQVPATERVRHRAYGALAFGDAAAQDRAVAELGAASDDMLHGVQQGAAAYARNLPAAERLARLLTAPTRPPALRADGYRALAQLAAAHGQWKKAGAELARAAGTGSATVPLTHASLAVLPFLAVPASELRAARDELRRWQPAASAPRSFPYYAEPLADLYPPLRTYLLGMLALRLGEQGEAAADAGVLDRLAAAAGTPSPRGRALARSLAAGLRAEAAGVAGRPAEALARLDRAPLRVSDDLLNLLAGVQAYERYQRAEALRALGRADEALPWYASLPETLQHGVVYLAPAHQREGEAAERRGDRAQAAAHYAQVVALWRDADPELHPEVAAVERRLAGVRPTPTPQ